MTLKFKMKDRETAYEKKAYLKETAEMLEYITLQEVIQNCGMPDVSDSSIDFSSDIDYRAIGWRWSDLNGMNSMIRTLKDRKTYLYLCDPPLTINEPETENKQQDECVPEESINDKIDEFISKLVNAMTFITDGRRKVMVRKSSKKKDVVCVEYPCWCHCWTTNRVQKEDENVNQLLAVCEFQDGHVEKINFDHVRFVEEWD